MGLKKIHRELEKCRGPFRPCNFWCPKWASGMEKVVLARNTGVGAGDSKVCRWQRHKDHGLTGLSFVNEAVHQCLGDGIDGGRILNKCAFKEGIVAECHDSATRDIR